MNHLLLEAFLLVLCFVAALLHAPPLILFLLLTGSFTVLYALYLGRKGDGHA